MSLFGNNLKRERELSRLSRQDIADRLNITPQAYGQYERGEREPKIDMLQKIAKVLHVSVDALIGNDAAKHLTKFEQYQRYLESIGYCIKKRGDKVFLFFPNDKTHDFGISFSSVDYFCEIAEYAIEKAQHGEEKRRAESITDTLEDFEQFVVWVGAESGKADVAFDPDEDDAPPAPDCPSEDAPPAPMNKQAATGGRSNSPRDSLPSQG